MKRADEHAEREYDKVEVRNDHQQPRFVTMEESLLQQAMALPPGEVIA